MTNNSEEGDKAAMVCSNCGTPANPDYTFCIVCGTNTKLSKRVCPSCGKENKYDSRFCLKCGISLADKPSPVPAGTLQQAAPPKPEYMPQPVPYSPATQYMPPAPQYVPQPSFAQPSKSVCPGCRFENEIGMQFCIKCGTKLSGQTATAYPAQYAPPAPPPAPQPPLAQPTKSVCPACRYENESSMQFCIKCGTKLSGQTATAYPPQYASAPYMPPAPQYSPAPQYAPVPHYTPAPQYASAPYMPPTPQYAPPAPEQSSSPSASAGKLRNVTITRASQFVCAANSYKIIVNGMPLGNIPVGRTITAPVESEFADVEIICTTIMINRKVRLKLRLGDNPEVLFSIQWPGDIFETVRGAQVLEKSY